MARSNKLLRTSELVARPELLENMSTAEVDAHLHALGVEPATLRRLQSRLAPILQPPEPALTSPTHAIVKTKRAGSANRKPKSGDSATSAPSAKAIKAQTELARKGPHLSLLSLITKLRADTFKALSRNGYIRGNAAETRRPGVNQLWVELKYNEGKPVIKKITQVSKHGRRRHSVKKGDIIEISMKDLNDTDGVYNSVSFISLGKVPNYRSSRVSIGSSRNVADPAKPMTHGSNPLRIGTGRQFNR